MHVHTCMLTRTGMYAHAHMHTHTGPVALGRRSCAQAPRRPPPACAAFHTPLTVAFARRTQVWLPKCPQCQTGVGAERHLGTWIPTRGRVRAWRPQGPGLRKWCPLGNVSIQGLLAKPVREEGDSLVTLSHDPGLEDFPALSHAGRWGEWRTAKGRRVWGCCSLGCPPPG